jgi:glycosyltransferase involved in cell wall biosynthesis
VSLAKRKNQNILVICTGECFDHRDPEYFKFILSELKRLDIESNVKIIGVVPYDDVLGLMKNSIAMINPSLFEGWSTTVEEAKSLNVKMLLSNINVHVEQAVNQAIFFSPYDPERLSELMLDIFNGQYRENLEIPKELLNKINMNRINEFARNYERIICDIYYEKII